MGDTNTTVHIGENSPEQVAYKLLVDVIKAEGKSTYHGEGNAVDRAYLLTTYEECLHVVKGYGQKKK